MTRYGRTPFCQQYINFNTKLLKLENHKNHQDFYYNIDLDALSPVNPIAQRAMTLLKRFSMSASSTMYGIPENGTGVVHSITSIMKTWNRAVTYLENQVMATTQVNPTQSDYIQKAVNIIDASARKENGEIDVIGYWGLIAALCEDAFIVSNLFKYRGYSMEIDNDPVKGLNTLALTRMSCITVPNRFNNKDDIKLYGAEKHAIINLVVYPSEISRAGHRLPRLALVWAYKNSAIQHWLGGKNPPRGYRTAIQPLGMDCGLLFTLKGEWTYNLHYEWLPTDIQDVSTIENLDTKYNALLAVKTIDKRAHLRVKPYYRYKPY
ncbi:hypothetical protein [Ranid herpesvirus 3]|uniref:Uncharacterized protein n=1 Tax=Ranid herpesvirus 3 TaxID=1987509 RepID=A0A1X9T5A6_9VIRU|nr:hypothetical protein [Ranid herpesvirus 3]ARR28884.1 hypothetical protein [Ranid herpesvirus 3]